MATICRYLLEFYEDVVNKKADPRVENLPLMSSPLPILGILLIYNYFVNKWGPQLMKSREPYDLKNVMILYDILQIIVNSYLFFICLKVPYIQLRYSLICQEVDYSDDPINRFIAQNVWVYFMVKVLDLLDTVFMVLRKKERQISFLHVYHHTGMVLACWVATKFIAGGHVIFIGMINAFVHTVMYFYYLLTAINPEYKKSIWWKKHLTELQMVQFVILAWHSAIVVLNPSCKFPKILMGIFFPQNFFMLTMFWDFYRKNYLSKKITQSEQVPDNKVEVNNNMEKIKDNLKSTQETCLMKEKNI
ncbi:very long chain fatty acid elongase 7 [Halyomorpha halys]|uniref:very long chain fatty acid elongase 7 n=1 Tax=Halyomorpha halys TaxID=286706 RepID=UPI0006D4CA36|nr:elongation of very long chain fatty acids protein 7-like [Halyomorpha halys]